MWFIDLLANVLNADDLPQLPTFPQTATGVYIWFAFSTKGSVSHLYNSLVYASACAYFVVQKCGNVIDVFSTLYSNGVVSSCISF